MEENEGLIIKEISNKLGFTYKELADSIGYSENTIKQAVSKGKVSIPLKKAIKLYVENLELKNKVEEFNNLQNTLKKIILN